MKGRRDRAFRHPGEGVALSFLEERGHVFLRNNYHTGFGEVDLITFNANDSAIHFVEVKNWKPGAKHGLEYHPLGAIHRAKQTRMSDAGLLFMSELEDAIRSRSDPEYGLYRELLGVAEDDSGHRTLSFVGMSFDLIWVKSAADGTYSCEYFPSLF